MNSKHIWEGWTVQDFINELEPTFNRIVNGHSWTAPFKDDKELRIINHTIRNISPKFLSTSKQSSDKNT
jgi:hypothetical protein